ncbi:MAG: hypothetical protein J5767_02960 [Paludibacteraceae bacterium]|nr:hypothetical protein [Paludibacteraceae bacterium]
MKNNGLITILVILFTHAIYAMAGGQIDTIRYENVTSGEPRYLTVYTPPSYHADSVYPVLYLLHGMHGNQYSWEDEAHIAELADSLIQGGIIEPLVIVMPLCVVNDTMTAYQLPSYFKSMHDFNHHIKKGEFEVLFPEIEAYVKAHYSIGGAKKIAGLSSGARQALNLSKQYHFDVVGLFSPVILQHQIPKKSTGAEYWIRCGSRDLFYARSRRINRRFNRYQIPHDFKKTKGRHNWQSWRVYIGEFLQSYAGR